jgi:N-acetylmuramoyl-L-alanine amidase
MDTTRRTLLFGATAAGGVALGANAWADLPASVYAVHVQPSGQTVRVTLIMDRAVFARTFFLTAPDRFVVDLANTRLRLPQGEYGRGPGGGLVRRYRHAPRPGGAARVVFDLDVPARAVRQDLEARSSELSFELIPYDFIPAPPIVSPPAPGGRRTIVVDAGHGGRDPGAIGANGIREKDVVLDIALQLRDVLEYRGYRVALTRDGDRFIELADRVRFARAQDADLFVSIHADSHADSRAQGASVYTISARGEARAQDLMGAQNWDLDLGDAPRHGVARDVLVDLYQRETTGRSAQFARLLIQQLRGVTRLLHNTHRNAGYFVLLTPDVPAVLIETGFLSNIEDARRLSDPRARRALAGAVAAAADAYFGTAPVRSRAQKQRES